ncbi:hypothetical protein C2I06_08875 [Niallia circulans]|nr:hypothetical protein C2I06_08875 [Niallia circulans]AYV70164.1 hypothetical protein C2H98_00475 [Niallia circulans]UQZ76968.1 hypothetical protein C2I17_21810 [Niallia circulans]
MSSAPFHSVFKDYLVPAFFSKENKTEQTEYTETPMGAARKSKTPQERSDEEAWRSPHGKRSVFSLRAITTKLLS